MNRWIRRILIVLEVGGGFAGLVMILESLQRGANMPAHAVIGFAVFACVFLFGVVSGLALVDRPGIGIVLSAVYQAVQIPIVSSSWVAYRLHSGAQIGILWSGRKAALLFNCGSRFNLAWMPGDALHVGVNVLALGLLIYLLTLDPKKRTETRQTIVVPQVHVPSGNTL